jgi:hypothetical protein
MHSEESEGEVFGRALKKAVRKDVETEFVPSLQAKLDLVYQTHRGRPVEEVASVLAQVVSGRGAKRPQAWTGYAAAISEGRRLRVQLRMPSGW